MSDGVRYTFDRQLWVSRKGETRHVRETWRQRCRVNNKREIRISNNRRRVARRKSRRGKFTVS